MKHFRESLQKPSGQVLLATLLFCFIFVVLFAGLYKAGLTYIAKERSSRATDLTVLSAGAVYANGLQWVRFSNMVDMGLAATDIEVILLKISPMLVGLPEDAPAIVAAAIKADPKTREKVGQKIQKYLFGIDTPNPGAYPTLIHAIAHETAQANQLSDNLIEPYHLYNLETGTAQNVLVPNMALRFRTAAELLPQLGKSAYSLMHDGERTYFSRDEVEPARNPRHHLQMRVKKDSAIWAQYAGWWVRKEKDGYDPAGEMGPLGKLGGVKVLNLLKDFLKKFQFDVTDRDDPPCHTYTLLGQYKTKLNGNTRTFYQVGEARVETNGLAAWDITHPITTFMQKADLSAFPILRQIPGLNSLIDRFNGVL